MLYLDPDPDPDPNQAAARDLDAAARLLRHDAEAAAVLEQLRSGLHDAAL